MLTQADCLPTGREERAEIGEVIGAINKHLHTCEITQLEEGKASIDELVFDTNTLYCYQNNEHHEEGWLYNHIIGMLQHLEKPENEWWNDDFRNILELAIFWSDLGKLSTLKDSPKKTWPDGTPQSTAFGHDKASAKMLEEALERPSGHSDAILWIVAEHMNAHQLSDMDEQGKTTIPDFLKPQVEGLDAWDWPEWEDLDRPHGTHLSKKAYAWIRRGASKLLRIKQQCDENGRISEVNF
tara:strand:- start:37 stop:756 length:720 start_codon:yes stop_codon:yes gene_type:complete